MKSGSEAHGGEEEERKELVKFSKAKITMLTTSMPLMIGTVIT